MPQYTQIYAIHIEQVKHEKLVLNEVIQRKDLPRWEIIFAALLVHIECKLRFEGREAQAKFWFCFDKEIVSSEKHSCLDAILAHRG